MLVSIHVPLAEHDRHPLQRPLLFDSFNSRAPRGARPTARLRSSSLLTFQFTCPSRSTTLDFTGLSHFFGVSIHVPLAEHDAPRRAHNLPTLVSIHVPLAEHDCGGCQPLEPVSVSIHVPLAEHDKTSCPARPSSTSFNSRAPRGARHCAPLTLVVRVYVSIHVPLAEHDLC